MNRKYVFAATTVLIVLIVFAAFLIHAPDEASTADDKFYVGVEYAYGYDNQTAQQQLAQLQELVDKVKEYTNLIVIGSIGLTLNQTALSQACDYIYNADLNFIVLFTGLQYYLPPIASPQLTYDTTAWMVQAQQKYGNKFLGIYRYDEPGGRTLEQGIDPIVNKTEVGTNVTYTYVGDLYVERLKIFPQYYLQFAPKVVTADFGLYWYDYQAGYSSIFAEFVGNESRERHIALCRGAADASGKDWGTIITWQYTTEPYLESADELYDDLVLAYGSGAKYAVVFSYPQIEGTEFGILTEQHFDALKRFWNDIHRNPALGSVERQAAYVLPANYGFGFRSPNDTIWGVFPADNASAKIFNDVNNILPGLYGSGFDLLYDQPPLTPELLQCYSKVHYWNQTVT